MEPPIARTAWAWLALLIALTLSAALCTYCLDGLVDPVKTSLHLSDGRMSFLLGWAYVGAFAAASLPGGWINDHAPRRRMLTLGAALWGLGAVCCALAHGFPQFCAGRMLVGLGQATLAPASFSILADSFPTRLRARVFGAALAAGGVGPGVGLTATGVLLSLAAGAGIGADWSWRLAILACATPAFILVFVLLAMPEPPRAEDVAPEAGASTSDRRFWLPLIVTLLAIAAVTLSDGAQLSWSAAALVREHALTVADAAKAAGLVFIFCGAAGPLLAGTLADLLYRRHGVAGRLIVGLAAVGLLIPLQFFFQASSTLGLLAVLTGAGLTVVTGEVIGAAVLQDFAPSNRRGLAASANSLFGSMAIGLGATGVAVFSKLRPSASHPVTHAMTLTTVPASVLALMVFLALWFVVRRSRDTKADLRMAAEMT